MEQQSTLPPKALECFKSDHNKEMEKDMGPEIKQSCEITPKASERDEALIPANER